MLSLKTVLLDISKFSAFPKPDGKKGDWIEMPKRGADGDVLDVNLTTVRVQEWDESIHNSHT